MRGRRSAIHSLVFSCFVAGAASLACFGQTGTFVQVSGSLSQISVGADGAVWGVDSSQRIFTYDSTSGQFVQVPGALTQIAVGNANAVWGINAQNQIYRWDSVSSAWTNISGSLTQIAVGADGDVWGVNSNAQVWHYDQQAQAWDYMSADFPLAVSNQITVGNDGSVYVLNEYSPGYATANWYNPGTGHFQAVNGYPSIPISNNGIGFMEIIATGPDGDLRTAGQFNTFHYDPGEAEWIATNGPVITQFAIGSGANAWGILAADYGAGPMDGPIYRWDAQTASWVSVPGALTQIAAGAEGSVWGVNSAHQVFHYVQAAQPYHTLTQLPGSFTHISVGADGTTWALDANDLIYAFDRGTQSFRNIPGALAQVSVAAGGFVWGVNAKGQIWQWGTPNESAWNYVPGELDQIAVTLNQPYFNVNTGTFGHPSVFGINAYGQTYVYNTSWVNIPGTLVQLSAGIDGTAWGINAQQQIYGYDSSANAWANVPGFLVQISVGNANNIWGVNAQQQVYQYDTTARQWDLIPFAYLTQIAVAFDGAVWGVNGAGTLYQWDSATKTFNVMGQGVTNVAVGNDNVVFAWNTNTGATYWWF